MNAQHPKLKAYVSLKLLSEDVEFMNSLSFITNDITIHSYKQRPTKYELKKIVKNYDIVIIGIKEVIDTEIASCIGKLKVLSSITTGMDHINVTAVKDKNVTLLTLKHSNATSVAEYTLSMILYFAKCLKNGDISARNGLDREGLVCAPFDLNNRRIGIVGAGKIAYNVARLAKAFNMYVDVWTKHPKLHPEFNNLSCSFVDNISTLFKKCDIISINIPLSTSTKNMITMDHINCINGEIILVNTSRKEIITPGVIKLGIEKGKIKGCGLDVFYDDDLNIKNNILFSPHIAGANEDSLRNMKLDLAEQLLNHFKINRSNPLY